MEQTIMHIRMTCTSCDNYTKLVMPSGTWDKLAGTDGEQTCIGGMTVAADEYTIFVTDKCGTKKGEACLKIDDAVLRIYGMIGGTK